MVCCVDDAAFDPFSLRISRTLNEGLSSPGWSEFSPFVSSLLQYIVDRAYFALVKERNFPNSGPLRTVFVIVLVTLRLSGYLLLVGVC